MILLDHIKNELTRKFSLTYYGIHPSLHGTIASVVVYGALMGANPD